MKNKSLFSKLLDNKKLLIIISLLLSFMFWIISSDDISRDISNVSVKYNLSSNAPEDLKIFSSSTDTVSVSVRGKRVVVAALTADDIDLIVDLSSVTGPVNGTFEIVPENKSSLDYDIEIKPDSLNLMIDREVTKTINVIHDFTYTPEGYYVDNNAPETIDITGPESIINSVHSAYIDGKVNSPDGDTVESTYDIKLYDMSDPTNEGAKEISSEYITMSSSSPKITFRYLKLKENIPFVIKCGSDSISLPSDYYTITPSVIRVAGPENLISGPDAIDNFVIDIGSLSDYKNQKYTLDFNVDDVIGESFVNKSIAVDSITVELDFSSLTLTTFDIPKSSINDTGLPDSYKFVKPDTFAVTVVGTKEAMSNLSETNFTVTYDFSEVDATTDSYVDVPVKIDLNTDAFCWVSNSLATDNILLQSN